MNSSFRLELVEEGANASIYTVRFEGETETEFEKFVSDPEVSAHPRFGELIAQLGEIINRYGCQDRFFKPESSFYDSVVALPRGSLRLYCCKLGGIILILGSGGVKKTRTYQEDPKLDLAVQMMAEVSRRLDIKMRSRDMWIHNITLKGDLNFSVDD